jgi:antitoxin MazE
MVQMVCRRQRSKSRDAFAALSVFVLGDRDQHGSLGASISHFLDERNQSKGCGSDLFILCLNKELTMTEAILSIKHWGNSLGVRLPQAVARAANLHADQQVRMVVEDGRVVIEPLPQASALSLEERLKRFDAARHGGEVMAVAAVGAERW